MQAAKLLFAVQVGALESLGLQGGDTLLAFGQLGIAAGFWLAPLLTEFAGFPTLISNTSVVLAFSVSAAIGVVFGFFPALKAANLDPIDALRYE